MFLCYSYTIIGERFLCNYNTETCWSCFNVILNVNLNIVFKTTRWCISW